MNSKNEKSTSLSRRSLLKSIGFGLGAATLAACGAATQTAPALTAEKPADAPTATTAAAAANNVTSTSPLAPDRVEVV